MRIWPREQADRNRMLLEYHKAHPGQRTYYLIQSQLRSEVVPMEK